MAKDKNNLCPVLALAKLTADQGDKGFSIKCREDRCQWWDNNNSKCAILVIAQKA